MASTGQKSIFDDDDYDPSLDEFDSQGDAWGCFGTETDDTKDPPVAMTPCDTPIGDKTEEFSTLDRGESSSSSPGTSGSSQPRVAEQESEAGPLGEPPPLPTPLEPPPALTAATQATLPVRCDVDASPDGNAPKRRRLRGKQSAREIYQGPVPKANCEERRTYL